MVISVDVARHVGRYMITRKVLLTVQMGLQFYLDVTFAVAFDGVTMNMMIT